MKRLGQKGFTLIELLAVITIMGILLLVAIPAVSRTIENARRDTFATVAKEYVNAVRNAVLADNISCNMGTAASPNWVIASATPDGDYYFSIDTSVASGGVKDLMESGGKSPFGNADMKGYVVWNKKTENASGSSTPTTKTTYKLKLADTGKHGLSTGTDKKPNEIDESSIKRANVLTDLAEVGNSKPSATTYKECTVN